MSTAREDIEALAAALEEEATEAREKADELDARAEALREVLAGMEEPTPGTPSFTSTQGQQ